MLADILSRRNYVMRSTVAQKHKAILALYVKGLYQKKYTLKQASESTGYSIQHLCRLKKSMRSLVIKLLSMAI